MEKVTTAKIKAPSRAIPSDPTEVYDGTDPRSQLDEAQSSHLAPMISKPPDPSRHQHHAHTRL